MTEIRVPGSGHVVEQKHVLALLEAIGVDPGEVSRVRIDRDIVTVERDYVIVRDGDLVIEDDD